MEIVRSPKRLFDIVLHDTEPQKTSVSDTALKASQKTVFFELYNVAVLFTLLL
jgi:hypothetical protein